MYLFQLIRLHLKVAQIELAGSLLMLVDDSTEVSSAFRSIGFEITFFDEEIFREHVNVNIFYLPISSIALVIH